MPQDCIKQNKRKQNNKKKKKKKKKKNYEWDNCIQIYLYMTKF